VSHFDQPRERRRFHRILFDAPASILLGGRLFETRLIDISLKGALLHIPSDWSAQALGPAAFEIRLDAGDTLIRMEGQVAHQEDDRLGLRCDRIDMDSVTHLRRLVELNLGDDELLERELEALG
jgi:hypothetical protein